MNKHEIVFALLLVNRGDKFNNSYRMIRVLERKFRIFPTEEIFDEIRKQEYVSFVLINGVHHYSMTSKGRDFLKNELEESFKYATANYPNDEVINGLFSFSANPDNNNDAG